MASGLVTWSPSVTLVPTQGCFNTCGYCSFRVPLEQAVPLSLRDAALRLQERPAAAEVLLLSGEVAPQAPSRGEWFARLRQLCGLALAAGRLPHTNAGPLSLREMAALARLNWSVVGVTRRYGGWAAASPITLRRLARAWRRSA